ncbi:hypothetical protein AYI69_g6215, partial [Smittium culicis]
MSHDGTNIQDATTAPEWAMELIRGISQLDNYIVEKSPTRDLFMYPELAESLPGISQDFFKSPITDLERRKFLGSCSRNSEMGLSSEFKKEDSKLHDIHSRRWNKPELSHQNQHGSMQDSQPVQHKPEAQSNNSGTFQRRIGNKDKIGYEEAREVGILNKFRKIELNPITIDSSSGDEDKFTTYELGDTKRKCQGPSKRSGSPDKSQENKLQKLSFFPRESSSYGSGPLSCDRGQKILWGMKAESDEFGNKCKRIASDHVCPETTSNTSICEETRRNVIPKLTKSFGGTMDTLYSNRNKTSIELRTVNTEPSRRAIKAEISNRMIAIQENVQHNREEVWTTRCRHVCDKQELPVR